MVSSVPIETDDRGTAMPNSKKGSNSAAQMALKYLQRQSSDELAGTYEPIAIVGVSLRFPGGIRNLSDFSQALENRELKCESTSKLSQGSVRQKLIANASASVGIERAGVLDEDIYAFDPEFFSILPLEAKNMDPSQRMTLELTWEAFENARIAPHTLKGKKVGVFLGVSDAFCRALHMETAAKNPTNLLLRSMMPNFVPARLAYHFDLKGPSLSIDTACSSSLVAVHQACQSIINRESEMAIAGGISLMLPDSAVPTLNAVGVLSPDGHCKTFDSKANGYGRGEGCGIVILKSLATAMADGDRILGVIRSTTLNQDGKGTGMHAPNLNAQIDLIKHGLKLAGIENPDEIGYHECHGTGTVLGDAVETEGIASVFGKARDKANPLHIGAVKSNIGHLEHAAGIAGLIKVLALFHSGKVLPSHGPSEISSSVASHLHGIAIPDKAAEWRPPGGRKIATLCSFSILGVNANAVIEEPPKLSNVATTAAPAPWPLPISARTPQALSELLLRHKAELERLADTDLSNYCWSTAVTNHAFRYRVVPAGERREEFLASISKLLETAPSIEAGKSQPKAAFMFTGQGSQYQNMAETLYRQSATFRSTVEKCNQVYITLKNHSLLDIVYTASTTDNSINETEYSQPAIYMIQAGLGAIFKEAGIEPDYVLGHSIGEIGAAHLAGILSLEDGMKLATLRGQLMQSLPKVGSMVAILADEGSVRAAIKAEGKVAIAAINGPTSIVISGESDSVQRVVKDFEQQGTTCVPLRVSHAFHSPLMEPILDLFRSKIRDIEFKTPVIQFISTVPTNLQPTNSEYWVQHIRESVNFMGAVNHLKEKKPDLVLELGPDGVLTGLTKRFAKELAMCPTVVKGQDSYRSLLGAIAKGFQTGLNVKWKAFFATGTMKKVTIPNYPFQRKTLVPDFIETIEMRFGETGSAFRASVQPIAIPNFSNPLPALQPKVVEPATNTNLNSVMNSEEKVHEAITESEPLKLLKKYILEVVPDLDSLQTDSSMRDMGLNSMDRVEVLTLVLEQLKLKISISELNPKMTIAEIAKFCEAKLGISSPSSTSATKPKLNTNIAAVASIARNTESTTWLKSGATTAASGNSRLVVFPFAGGEYDFFLKTLSHFSESTEVHFVELPGHGEKRSEIPEINVRKVVSSLAKQIASLGHRERVHFLGFEMGATLAALVSEELKSKHSVSIESLIAIAPGVRRKFQGQRPAAIEDAEFINTMSLSGWRPRNGSLALLRADLILAENLEKESLKVLNCSVHLLREDSLRGEVLPGEMNPDLHLWSSSVNVHDLTNPQRCGLYELASNPVLLSELISNVVSPSESTHNTQSRAA